MSEPRPEPQEKELALNDIATLLFAFWHAPYPSTRAQIEAFIARHVDGVTIAQLRQCDLGSAERDQLREALRQKSDEWRAEAANFNRGLGENSRSGLLTRCADELSALLAAADAPGE